MPSPIWPAASAAGFPPPNEPERATSAQPAGRRLAPLLVVPIMAACGWRAAFFIFGAVGLVWAAVWYAWYRDQPADNRAITPKELAEIGHRPARPAHAGVPWRRLFSNPQLWLIMLMYWCYVWGSMFYLSWFPTYLVKGRGLSEAESVYAALAFIIGAIGNLAGGYLCDYLSQRFGLSLGRRLIGSLSLGGSALLILATALTNGKASGVILLALGFGLMDCMLPAAWATCLDIGQHYAGAVTGAIELGGPSRGVRLHGTLRIPGRGLRISGAFVSDRGHGADGGRSLLADRPDETARSPRILRHRRKSRPASKLELILMDTRTRTRTDLQLSPVCLGTMTFGTQAEEATAARMLAMCLDRGVNFVDTANVYNAGHSEEILGRLLRGQRDKVVLASKVGLKMGTGPHRSGLEPCGHSPGDRGQLAASPNGLSRHLLFPHARLRDTAGRVARHPGGAGAGRQSALPRRLQLRELASLPAAVAVRARSGSPPCRSCSRCTTCSAAALSRSCCRCAANSGSRPPSTIRWPGAS